MLADRYRKEVVDGISRDRGSIGRRLTLLNYDGGFIYSGEICRLSEERCSWRG